MKLKKEKPSKLKIKLSDPCQSRDRISGFTNRASLRLAPQNRAESEKRKIIKQIELLAETALQISASGDQDLAIAHLEEAKDLTLTIVRPDSEQYGLLLGFQAKIYADHFDIKLAQKFYKKSLKILRSSTGYLTEQYCLVLDNYADLMKLIGRLDKAEEYKLGVLSIQKMIPDIEESKMDYAYTESIAVLDSRGKYTAASSLREEMHVQNLIN